MYSTHSRTLRFVPRKFSCSSSNSSSRLISRSSYISQININRHHSSSRSHPRCFSAAAVLAKEANPNKNQNPSDKVFGSAAAALQASGLKSGDTVCAGGFGVCGIPTGLINAIKDSGVKDLTLVSNNCGLDGWGNGILINNRQVKRMVSSFVGKNEEFARQYLSGELEVEFVPQGTLAEKLRAGGAGIPAFYTPTGYGTMIEKGDIPIKYDSHGEVILKSAPKPTKNFNGRDCVLEEAIIGDISIVKCAQADTFGNCRWRGTSQNFNPDVATAGKYTIVEADEIVPLGHFKAEDIQLSGAFVNAIIEDNSEKRIEVIRHTLAKDDKNNQPSKVDKRQTKRDIIINRAAQELTEGMVVNLGIGMPCLIPNFVSEDIKHLWLQAESGVLGIGPYPLPGEEDADYINPDKAAITLLDGSSVFCSSTAFTMIRGGHIDLTILGAMEVSQFGDIANWMIPGKFVKGMGGAMDLVSCGTRVIATLEHTDKKGQSKILQECKLPLTGANCVSRIITDLCVFDVDKVNGLTLIELLEDATLEQVEENTQCTFRVSSELRNVKFA